MKSGTSTLADYLASSSDIDIPSKEVHYFNRDENYRAGLSWYSKKLTEGVSDRRILENRLVGEKTPTYSYQPNCASRIKETIPDAKLIWIFRDPVQRAFSNYLHAKKKGVELLSFGQSVKREKERTQRDIFYGYVERGKYVLQIERFLELFAISDMHFLLFENLVHSPQDELANICAFLGVSPVRVPLEIHSNKTSVMPFLPVVRYFVKRIVRYDRFVYKAAKEVYLRLASRWPEKNPSIPADVANELSIVYAPYNKRLAELTGLDLRAWQTPSLKNSSV